MADHQIATSYDRVAADYTARIADELSGKPLDRGLLLAFAEQVGALGPILDVGCGPGQVAAFLAAAGAAVEGMDLSSGMIDQARLRSPALAFRQGDMRSIAAADATYGGITAFYCIIHLTPAELVPTFQEWWRILRPAGLALISFHLGDSIVHRDEWWDHTVDLDFRFLPVEQVTDALSQAHFTIEAQLQRSSYPGVEFPSQRAYLLVRKSPIE